MILATGATENGLVFSGNTLPGVLTAGAAQTLVNIQLVRPGKRAVVVGSGNVGLIVAYQLLQAGIEVAAIVEVAPKLSGYAVHAGKVCRAGVPILLSHTVLRAEGEEELKQVVICKVDENMRPIENSEQCIEADLLCLSVGLSPRVELAAVAGCKMDYCAGLGGRVPAHNKSLQTSMENVWVAGDLAGVEEASTALDEGRLAGLQVAFALKLIKTEAYHTQEKMLQKRIASLRQGDFGAKRQGFKEQLWSSFDELQKGVGI